MGNDKYIIASLSTSSILPACY